MDSIIGMIIGGVVGFIFGICACYSGCTSNEDIALKLSNIMNASMLDCVTQQIITKEQVHNIETVFHKHIEENFKHIKANHEDKNES